MLNVPDSALITHCPDQGKLLSFTLGKLSGPQSEQIAEHLASCPWCESVLQDLDSRNAADAVMENVRRCFDVQPLREEQGCVQLEAAAKLLSVTSWPSPQTATARPVDGAECWVGRRLGNYEIVELLGRGGMGVVFKARQLLLNRMVALKMIQAGPLAGPSTRHRFGIEGEAIARLQHPNIVQIHDFGTIEDLPFFSMEYLEGGSLSARLAQSALPPRQAAELLLTLADAVDYVHNCQVVHRDLKPTNILLTEDGVPKISDFGLAKLLDLDGEHTRSEHILGTPSYMAPEQAKGGPDSIGPPVDIYALGVILYESLTGQRPFRGSSKGEILAQVCGADPPPPSTYCSEVPRDLEAVCLKCLEKDPRNRYATGRALVDDLQRWLAGEPTQARPLRWPGKTRRAFKRYRAALGLALVLLGALAAASWRAPINHLPEIEAEIKQGRALTLVGETGKPKWFRLLTGQDTTTTSLAPDGTFSLHSWGLALVELLPDTYHDRYQITAEVRHEKADIRGEAGLYFGRQGYPGLKGDFHLFVDMAYNDVRSVVELFGSLPGEIAAKIKPPKGNVVTLASHVHTERGDKYPFNSRTPLVAGATFKHSGWSGGPWRKLEIAVDSAGANATWNGTALRELKADNIISEFDRALTSARKKYPDDPHVAVIKSAFSPTSGLGFYLYKGSASLRNVRVTPFPGD